LEDGVILELEAKPATEEKNPLQEHEENHVKGGEFLKSMLYGGFDGILTTFALMMSLLASGEENSTKILALGIANLIADGISMGVADFFSSKSEQEMTIKERDRETWEV
jgi:VIT1/CCC1 family predicted Fe2+/Mn2+ transporter